MSTSGNLDALIARLEAAREVSRELDAEIAIGQGWQVKGLGLRHWVNPEGETNQLVPFYTESLDAAMTLCDELGLATVSILYAVCDMLEHNAPGAPWDCIPRHVVIAALKARREAQAPQKPSPPHGGLSKSV